jgi:hypothetical protein
MGKRRGAGVCCELTEWGGAHAVCVTAWKKRPEGVLVRAPSCEENHQVEIDRLL